VLRRRRVLTCDQVPTSPCHGFFTDQLDAMLHRSYSSNIAVFIGQDSEIKLS
jgi:hypothetical protein